MADTGIILIRHGETHWNREGRIQGSEADSDLTPLGREQARCLANRLVDDGIRVLYSSDLGRTRATAAPIGAATGLAIVHDKALRERAYGEFEGRTFAEIESGFPVEYARLRSRDPHYAPPRGESAAQFRERVLAALLAIAARESGKRVAVVTHGGVLGILYREAMGMTLEARRSYSIANASLNHFRFADGRWVLVAWGDVAHLPAGSADAGVESGNSQAGPA